MKTRTIFALALLIVFSSRSYGKGGTNQVIFAAAEQGEVPLLQQIFATNSAAYALRDSLLLAAAARGQKGSVEFLIDKGADVNTKGFFDMEPIANMAMYGTTNDEQCAEVATVLLARGAEVDPVDKYGATPLFHAVELNKIKLARVLLEHGANPASPRKGSYRVPLQMAVRNGHLEMAKLLLDFKASPDVKDPDGNVPMLIWAIERRKHELARMLVEHGATITAPRSLPPGGPRMMNTSQPSYYMSYNIDHLPLLAALEMAGMETFGLMLQRSNAPVDAIDESGETPLFWAIHLRRTNAVRLLLDAKARINITNNAGATPMLLAQTSENQAITDMLRQAAAARGMTLEEVNVPSRADMRAIAKRICDGEPAALDEFAAKAQEMYGNKRKSEAYMTLNADRMHAAFDVLGEQAGKGNANALQALKTCLDRGGSLKGFAPEALGIAAAAGSDESLNLLLRYRDWNILENEAASALALSAKENKGPAVDFFVALALDPESARHSYYGVGWLVKDVLQASVTNGNPAAKDALDKFLTASKL